MVRPLLHWSIPCIVIASYVLLALQPDLRMAVPLLIGLTACIVIILSMVLYLGESGAIHWSPALVMIVAIIIRLLFLFRPPELSDDLYRYVWDGLQVLNGHNPYALAPSDIQPQTEAELHLLSRVNHAELTTIYPPAAQLVFTGGAALGGNLSGMKILLTVIDLFTCAFILKVLSLRGEAPCRSVLYAWHPLPVLEIAASGHIDSAGIFFLILSIFLLISRPSFSTLGSAFREVPPPFLRQRLMTVLSGSAYACSLLVKLVPFMFLPGLVILSGRGSRLLFLIGMLAGGTALVFPFLPELKHMLVTLDVYARNWEFAGFAYRSLRIMTDSGYLTRLLLALTFLIITTYFSLKLHFIIKGSTFKAGSDARAQTDTDSHSLIRHDHSFLITRTFYGITMTYLLLTPTLHPWYALYLVCFLPFCAGPAGIVLTWSVLLSYRVLIQFALLGQWIEDDVTPALIGAAPIAAFILNTFIRRASNKGR